MFRGAIRAVSIELDLRFSIFTNPRAPGCDPGLNVMILSGLQIMNQNCGRLETSHADFNFEL